MSWINRVDERKFLIIGGVLLVTLSTLIVTALRNPITNDSYWHLQMGKDWIENGLSPWIDHYSYTFTGEAILNPPVMFQALLYVAVSTFGVGPGFLTVKLGCFILILGMALLLLRQMKASTVMYAIALPMVAFLLQLRALVRPELISYALAIVALMFYFRANNRITTRNVWPMVFLILFWTNYHSSIVGYVIFCGFFVDCAFELLRQRSARTEWLRWFGWGLLLVAAGFLNPGFSHPVIQAITFPSEWKTLISEYNSPVGLKDQAAIYVLILLALLTPVLAYRQRRFGYLLIWAVLAYAAVTVLRMVAISGIVITMLAVNLLVAGNFPYRWNATGRKVATATGLLTLVLVSTALYSNVDRSRNFMDENRKTATRFPRALADYMITEKKTGQIFNDYGVGGYLIYRLSGQNQVFIDGRTHILYPVEHLKTFIMASTSPEVLRTQLDRYQTDMMIWKMNPTRQDLMHEFADFGLDFMDGQYVLYVRNSANFPLLGKLIARPACWKPEMLGGLNDERRNMEGILPYYSYLYDFADLVVGYSNAADGREFLDRSFDMGKWNDEMRRFAGFRFLESGQDSIATILFGGIEDKKPQDYLAAAMAMLRKGLPEAGQPLAQMAAIPWDFISQGDRNAQYQLWDSLAKLRELAPREQEFVHSLEELLTAPGNGNDPNELSSAMFCTNSEKN